MKKRILKKVKSNILNKPAGWAACLVILCLQTGCGMAGGNFRLALEEVPSGGDRLVGIFITDQYISSGMPEITLNSRGELVAEEQDLRIYAVLDQDNPQTPLIFQGLSGYGIYSLQEQSGESHFFSDDIFTDLHFTVSDEMDLMEASLYVSTERPCSYYLNPVYQQSDGQVYLLPGSGFFSDSYPEGYRYNQNISQSQSSGPTGKEETVGSGFTINIIASAPTENTQLLFMSNQNQVLQTLSEQQLNALFQKERPQLEIPDHTAYLILQQTKLPTGEVCRILFDHGAEYLEYMVSQEQGYLHPRQLPLVWTEDTP